MTKQEYNATLKRYYKAMDWFDKEKDSARQEKFLPNFEELLDQLEQGCEELNPNNQEILGGFKTKP